MSRPAPKPRSTGRGWMVLSLVLMVLLFFASLDNLLPGLTQPTRTGRQSGQVFEEVVVERAATTHKIVILDVEGLISSRIWGRGDRNMVELIADQLRTASRDPAVKAVILKVDSPGGEVLASDDISRAIVEFQEETGKPVISAMGGLAASGGYYVSAPCRWIVANELTITGSIGVIMQTVNYHGLMEKVGLHPLVFKSGRFKDMLGGSKPPMEIEPEAKEMIQGMVNETFQKFKSVVVNGRQRANELNGGAGRALAEDWEDFADGRILTGKAAYDLGFVDELGSFAAAVDRAKALADIQDATLIRYQEPFDLSRFLGLFGEAETRTLKIDTGVTLPKLEAGRLYFLAPFLFE